jgi:hypothetical protein
MASAAPGHVPVMMCVEGVLDDRRAAQAAVAGLQQAGAKKRAAAVLG